MIGTRDILSKYFLRIYAVIIVYSLISGIWGLLTFRPNAVDSNNDGEYNISEVMRTFDKSLIYRAEPRMYLDVGLIIDKDLYESPENYFDDDVFLKDIIFEIKNILSWHRVEFNIKNLDIALIDKNIFDKDSAYHHSAVEKLQYRDVENPLDFYILYYNSTSTLFHSRYFGYMHCKGNSILLQNMNLMGDFLAKNFAEQTVRDIIIQQDINIEIESDCECPYNNTLFCIHRYNNEYLNIRDERIIKIFTHCEMNAFYSIALYNPCLFETDIRPRLYTHCGDGTIDENEECDCGPEIVCKMTKQDECCYYDTCKFKHPSYQCSDGICCENCLFKRGSICRKTDNECDPEEFCNGISYDCPVDQIYEQYTICNNGIGICINGMCSNFNSLCKYVYKIEHVYFDYSCYDELLSIFKTECESKTIKYMLNYTCNRLEKCDNFICASKQYLFLPGNNIILVGNKYCIIPSEHSLKGWFKQSADYLKCGNDHNHYCYNSTCSSDKTALKNCKNGVCKDIDNSIEYVMNKKLSIKPHEEFLVGYNHAIYLNTIKKDIIAKIKTTIYIIPIISVIGIIFILICTILFNRKRIFRYARQTTLSITRI